MANDPMKQKFSVQEASDPETDPERLRELATYREVAVQRAAWQNPNLPEEVWREALLHGYPEAWANPMAPFYLLSWLPREGDWRTLERAARSATESLWVEPERCSIEGKQLLAAKVTEAWATSVSAKDMMTFLGRWAFFCGKESEEHKKVVRILVRCVKTIKNLTQEDLDLLHSIKQWSKGSESYLPEVLIDNRIDPIKYIYLSTQHPSSNAYLTIRETIEFVAAEKAHERGIKSIQGHPQFYKEAKAEHDRLLADLIRREMPVPPTTD